MLQQLSALFVLLMLHPMAHGKAAKRILLFDFDDGGGSFLVEAPRIKAIVRAYLPESIRLHSSQTDHVKKLPGVRELKRYAAVFLYAAYAKNTKVLSEILAEYVRQGGVVIYSVQDLTGVGTKFSSMAPLRPLNSGTAPVSAMGEVWGRPFGYGVGNFRETKADVAKVRLREGAKQFGKWNDGQPLIATSKNGRLICLNFDPAVVQSKRLHRLLANVVSYAANLPRVKAAPVARKSNQKKIPQYDIEF